MRGLADGLDPDSAYLRRRAGQGASRPARRCPTATSASSSTRQYYLRSSPRATDRRPPRRACRPATTSARSTASRRATCRCSKARALLRGAARHEGHADDHSRQRRRPARGRARAREAVAGPLVTSKLIGTDVGYLRIASFRNGVVEELKKQAADLTKGGAQEPDRRRSPHGRGPARKRHRGGPRVHQVRNAGHQGRPRPRPKRASRWRPPLVMARSTLPATVLVTTGTSGRGGTLRRRAERQRPRRSRSASARSAAPASRNWSSFPRAAACGSRTRATSRRRAMPIQGKRSRARCRRRRSRCRVRRARDRQGSDPRRRARAHEAARSPPKSIDTA